MPNLFGNTQAPQNQDTEAETSTGIALLDFLQCKDTILGQE